MSRKNALKNDSLIIEGLLASIDFDRIYKTMECLKWYWDQDSDPPSIRRLREEAARLLHEACSKKLCYAACGGFEVWRDGDDLGINFVVEGVSISGF